MTSRVRRWWNAWIEVGVAGGFTAGPRLPPARAFSTGCAIVSAALVRLEAKDAGVDPVEWWETELALNGLALATRDILDRYRVN